MTPEPIPDNALPRPEVIDHLLRGPELDAQGRITDGVYAGMTPAEVLEDRERFRRICE
jgi:hypothetical protein